MNAPQIKEFRSGDIVAQAEQEFEGVPREYALWLMEHEELPLLLAAASARRDKWIGKTISFSKKVFIPLTRLCRDYCGYCTFRHDPGQPGGAFLIPTMCWRIGSAGRAAGCKEALFSLGDQPEALFPEAAEDLRRMGLPAHSRLSRGICRSWFLIAPACFRIANPGVMDRAVARAPEEFERQHGPDAREHQHPADARWLSRIAKAPDKVPLLRLRTIEEAGKPVDRVHHGNSDRHRRNARGTHRLAAGDSCVT